MSHRVKGFGIVSKAEVDVFLELSCFFDDLTDVGNMISGSSAFSKSGLNFQMFKLVLEKTEEPDFKLPTSLDHGKSKRVPEKHLFLLY